VERSLNLYSFLVSERWFRKHRGSFERICYVIISLINIKRGDMSC